MNNSRPKLDRVLVPRASILIRFAATGGYILLHRNFGRSYLVSLALTAIVLFFVFLSIGRSSIPFTDFSLPLPTGSVPFTVLAFVYLAVAPVQIFAALRNSGGDSGSPGRDDSGKPIIQGWLPFNEAVTKRVIEPLIMVAVGAVLTLIWYPTISLGVGVWLIFMGIAMLVRDSVRPWQPKDSYLTQPKVVVTQPGVSNTARSARGDPRANLDPELRELMESDQDNK